MPELIQIEFLEQHHTFKSHYNKYGFWFFGSFYDISSFSIPVGFEKILSELGNQIVQFFCAFLLQQRVKFHRKYLNSKIMTVQLYNFVFCCHLGKHQTVKNDLSLGVNHVLLFTF